MMMELIFAIAQPGKLTILNVSISNFVKILKTIESSRRWEDKKRLSEKKWYSKYYRNFYEQTYLPYMDNFASYLVEGRSAPKSDFWRWYLNTYLRENKYP